MVTHMQLTHIDIDVLVVSIHTHACVRTCVFAEDTPATTTASPTRKAAARRADEIQATGMLIARACVCVYISVRISHQYMEQ